MLWVESQVWSSVGLHETFESLGVWFRKLLRNVPAAFLGIVLLNLTLVRKCLWVPVCGASLKEEPVGFQALTLLLIRNVVLRKSEAVCA